MSVMLLCEGAELIAHALTEDGKTVGRHDVWFGVGKRICGLARRESTGRFWLAILKRSATKMCFWL